VGHINESECYLFLCILVSGLFPTKDFYLIFAYHAKLEASRSQIKGINQLAPRHHPSRGFAFTPSKRNMSTFDGIVDEFPRIRIDFFRTHPSLSPPLACFLSHIHSDHLQGLESLKSPFVYCSPATRRLLLRMEKYPHRMNFAKGILEVRKQTYRHLQLILKAIPLQTPTEIELGVRMRIRVTLFDANHCPGAVMFLIEGDGKAILYTGDIRAEPWWVNSLVRNPVLIPYTLGDERLDCVYLDTTFASKDDIYQDFPAKATGLQELLQKVNQCHPKTVFYFRSWTLGYEDVWLVLSAALRSQVHVDDYQFCLYHSLSEDYRDGFSVPEAPALNGFQAGNHIQPGCLTTDGSNVRIHSCEPGTACHAQLVKDKDVVWITPIITRSRDGADVYEIGAGGGGGELYQGVELDIADLVSVEALADLCVQWLHDPTELATALGRLSSARASRNSMMSLDDLGLDSDAGISLKQLVSRMASFGDDRKTGRNISEMPALKTPTEPPASGAIHFPYSRHASYNELRHLVSVLKPKDVCPCTVDEDSWSEEISMQTLFGDLCSERYFNYDRRLRARLQVRSNKDETAGIRKRKREDQQETQESESSHQAYRTANGSFEVHTTEAGLLNTAACKRGSHDDAFAHAGAGPGELAQALEVRPANLIQPPSQILQNPGSTSFIHLTEGEEPHSSSGARLEAIKSAFEAITRGSNMNSSDSSRPSDKVTVNQEQDSLPGEVSDMPKHESAVQEGLAQVDAEPESQLSLTTSAFEPHPDDSQDRELSGLQLDGTSENQNGLLRHHYHAGNGPHAVPQNTAEGKNMTKAGIAPMRMYAIKEAYRAARRCLQDGADVGRWDDLSLRSVGRKGHIEEEIEL
jgi:DNA cross-link repair 1C protein